MSLVNYRFKKLKLVKLTERITAASYFIKTSFLLTKFCVKLAFILKEEVSIKNFYYKVL